MLGPGGPSHRRDRGTGDGTSGGPGGPGDGGRVLDPQAVAAAIQSELAQSEGTGVSAATERLLVASTRLGRLSATERAVVKQRLADLVDRLPDEVRQQLLRVVPNDDPRKCELLTEVLDDLPTQRLLDLVPRVDMKRGTHVSPFLTFLVRLCSVAAREASVSEAVETQLGRFDLPTDLVHAGSDHVRAVLEQAFSQTAEHYTSIGELYQSSVNEFSISFEANADSEARRLVDAGQDARATTEHAARVAVALVRLDPRDVSTVACLTFARDAATRTLAGDGKLSLLAELAAVASLVAESSPGASTHALVQECLALCRQPMALEQLINAIGDHVGAPSDTLTALFVASGLSGTVLAVTRMTDLPDGAFRDRLGELVARQELDIVRSALTRLRKDDHPVMIVLNVLRVLDPIRAPELCRLFIRDPKADIRRLALDMLREAPLSPSEARARDDPGDGRSRRRRRPHGPRRPVRQPDAERAGGADEVPVPGRRSRARAAADLGGGPAVRRLVRRRLGRDRHRAAQSAAHLQRRPPPGVPGDGARAVRQARSAGPGRRAGVAAFRRRLVEHRARREKEAS